MVAAAAIVLAGSPVKTLQRPIGSRVVLATVTDTGNRPLVELSPDDFAVQEDGRSRDILSLHMADYPMAILLDDTDAAAPDRDALLAAAARFVSKIGERSIAVGTVTNPALLLVPLDTSRADVLQRIRGFQAVPGGTPRPLEATAMLARAVLATGSPFAAIVVISAHSIPSGMVTDRAFLTPIVATGAPVYVVARRGANAVGAAADDDVLRAIAEQTHGLYTAIFSSASYAVALDRLADRLATEMMIEYIVPGAEPPASDVRVGVKIPGARATGLGVSK